HDACGQTRFVFRLGLRADWIHRRYRAERWRELLSLIGQPSFVESESTQTRHTVGGGDRYAARPGRVRNGSQQAGALLLEDSANPPRPVADNGNGPPAAL